MGRDLSCRSLDHRIRGTHEKIFEKRFGVLPEYMNNLSINRSDLFERE